MVYGASALCGGHLLSPDGREALTAPSSDLEGSLACHLLVLSKTWLIFPSAEHNIYHLHSAAGPGPGWVNIMYGGAGSSWRLRWVELNGELGSDGESMSDNKAATDRLSSKTWWWYCLQRQEGSREGEGEATIRNESHFPINQQLNALFDPLD